MKYIAFGHLPWTFMACACVGWGKYQAAISLTLIGIAFTLSAIALILQRK